MGSIFRKVVTRPIPAGAILTHHPGGRLTAKWTPRGARRPITVDVVTLDDGRRVIRQESAAYFARYRDADRQVREVSTGCRDETAARQFLAELERRADRVRAGVITPAEAAAADHANALIGGQIDAYLATLTGSAAHRKDTGRYVRRLAADCRWPRLADMRRDDLETWLADQARVGRSARSRNAYQTAAVSFVNWCARSGRMTGNPFAGMAKANLDADRRRQRRALSPAELARLVQAASDAPGRPPLKATEGDAPKGDRPAERLSGRERAALYAFLAGTGLRIGEVRKLTVGNIDLTAAVPHVHLPGAITKNGKTESVPLRSDLVALLRERIEGRDAADAVFHVPADLIRRFHADCRRAGIPRRDARGRTVDLHSLRTTFGTYLAAAGVAPRVAQALMRHSDIRLTMGVYTDPALFDLAGAVESIPSVATSVAVSVAAPRVSEGHSQAIGVAKRRKTRSA